MRQQYTCIFKRTLSSRVWVLPTAHRCVWLWLKLAADPEGFVCADVAGVAYGAHVTGAEAREALEVLALPDADADPEDPHEGRIIERVKGGWRVLGCEEDRDLAKLESKRARTRQYMRNNRARVANDVTPPSHSDPVTVTVTPPIPTPKPTPKPNAVVEDNNSKSPLPPVGVAAVVISARIDKIPEDWTLSDELRAEAAMAGVVDVDARVAALRLGPIGGTRGIFPDKLDSYISGCIKNWKVWGETERAKARAAAAAPPSSRSRFVTPAPEPKAKHLRVAKRFGIDLGPIIAQLAETKIAETLGTDGWHEHLEKAIARECKRKSDGRAA